MARITKAKICNAISRSLIEYGYPDASPEVISEVYDAFRDGVRFPDLPHDVIGGFAEKQLQELQDIRPLPEK
ncbi:hypothetical protein JYP46_01320 [Nitratireductor aquimarinus]|uniref:hypothetical protein n=1 Tax=Alphaproteobacteria TaxID=28211 RepID=UPI0019D3E869|nr:MULTISPECIES: hypothetical protein [Alphaproteobacteria]MBN7755450.1 hypothetical protein [Nitratireductor aquimarinus]MBY5998205.1 hypothetical protein [Tritonibacter mobilis]MBY6020232.1 hypothetical protein [Nitratireductor sp. DP7N14-4]